MTHIILLAEGFPDGFKNFERDVRELVYPLEEPKGMSQQIQRKAQITVREFKLYDIVVKEKVKEQFLSDLKPFVAASVWDLSPHDSKRKPKETTMHGVDGKGFKVGMLRKMLNTALRLLNAKPLDMSRIKTNEKSPIYEIMKRNNSSWHGHYMVIGELPDGYNLVKNKEET